MVVTIVTIVTVVPVVTIVPIAAVVQGPGLFYCWQECLEHGVLAEEIQVVDGDAALWRAVRPLLDVALRLEQNEETYVWHGWNRQQIGCFLQTLPSHCSLVIGVWEVVPTDGDVQGCEQLTIGAVCEVSGGQVCSLRTFEALIAAGLKPLSELEPGLDDALEIMRLAQMQVAPVAWALFTEKATWDEWLLANGDEGAVIDKGDMLASLARQGRCVLMGSQVAHHH